MNKATQSPLGIIIERITMLIIEKSITCGLVHRNIKDLKSTPTEKNAH
jgi:hypothetical protein